MDRVLTPSVGKIPSSTSATNYRIAIYKNSTELRPSAFLWGLDSETVGCEVRTSG